MTDLADMEEALCSVNASGAKILGRVEFGYGFPSQYIGDPNDYMIEVCFEEATA